MILGLTLSDWILMRCYFLRLLYLDSNCLQISRCYSNTFQHKIIYWSGESVSQNNSDIFQPKHIIWTFKRTASMRQFFFSGHMIGFSWKISENNCPVPLVWSQVSVNQLTSAHLNYSYVMIIVIQIRCIF